MKTKERLKKTKSLKWLMLLSMYLFFGINELVAQDQFLWIGDGTSTSWTNKNNWVQIPATGPSYPANYYPGQGGLINVNGSKDDVAMFTNAYNGDCRIDKPCAGTYTALRVGGILVDGYTGTIIQMDGNRFNVSEADDAGGYGVYDGITEISATDLIIDVFIETPAYRAYFDFGVTGGSFLGGTTIVLGLNYGMLIAVPLEVKNIDIFRGPKDELRIRQDASFDDGTDFDNSQQGAVVLSNRNAGLNTHDYYFKDVVFWNFKVASNGGTGPPVKEFLGGSFTVENDFSTTGAMGVVGAGSTHLTMNGSGGTEIHIHGDLIVGNVFSAPSYTAALAFGNIVLVLDGANNQHIKHNENENEFNGNLPALRIEKSTLSGSVILEGPTTVNNYIEFVSGIVYPDGGDPATSQGNLDLTIPNLFVINSNTTVSGATDLSYCNGPIRCRTGKSIELPIGKNFTYRPALINAISGVSADYSSDNMYTAEYFIDLPTVGVSNKETNLATVSDCEVWAIQKSFTGDSYTLDLELGYDPVSGSCTPFLYAPECELVLTRWDMSDNEWVSHGGDAGTTSHGDLTIGSTLDITSADFERSTPRPDLFTFGDYKMPACDSCFVSAYANYCVDSCEFAFETIFDIGVGSTFYSVSWDFGDGTSTLLNPVHTFTTIGYHEVSVEVCAISGLDTCCATYTFGVYSNDCTPSPSMAHLINSKVDVENVSIELTEQNELEIDEAKTTLEIRPNPAFNGEIKVDLTTEERGSFNYEIVNSQGRVLIQGIVLSQESNTINTTDLSPGVYLITVYLSNSIMTKRIVIGS